MAKASRNERRKARLKRTASLLRRENQLLTAQRQSITVVISALLAQNGGEMTITQGTINQVLANTSTLGFQMEPSKVEGEFTVRLVVATQGGQHVDTVDDIDPITTDLASQPDSLLSPVSGDLAG